MQRLCMGRRKFCVTPKHNSGVGEGLNRRIGQCWVKQNSIWGAGVGRT